MHPERGPEEAAMRGITLYRSVAAGLAAALLSLPAWSAPVGVAAAWVPRQVHYVYQGFTTRYSCDGLRDKIHELLWKLGARQLKVLEDPCSSSPGRPDPFPRVRVKMQVLVPAAKAGKGAPRVQAHWQPVVLSPSDTGYDLGGNCELIEQFHHTFLPLFSTRNTHYHATCIPHQATLGAYLRTEVLMPDRPAAKRPRPGRR